MSFYSTIVSGAKTIQLLQWQIWCSVDSRE